MLDISKDIDLSDEIDDDINLLEEDFDDKLREIQQNIQSVTSISVLQDNNNFFAADPQLGASISCRQYDEMENEAITEATKYYFACHSNDMSNILQNQLGDLQEFNTENDNNYNNWEILPEQLPPQKIQFEIVKLQKKLLNLNEENQTLALDNEKHSRKLKVITEQNQKLKELKVF